MFSIEQLRELSDFREHALTALRELGEKVQALEAKQEKMAQAIDVLVQGKRRIHHGQNGPEALEILDHNDEVFASRKLLKDQHGRITGSEA